MKTKKRIFSAIIALVTTIALNTTVSAHKDDYSPGTYTTVDKGNLTFRVAYSGQTDILTYDQVYKYGLGWNDYSSNVNVKIEMQLPGVAFTPGLEMSIVGNSKYGDFIGHTLFFTSVENYQNYIKTRNSEYLAYMSQPCTDVMIEMNTRSIIDDVVVTPSIMRKTFIHEIGHSLRMKHPEEDADIEGHNMSGFPYAVMNQGIVTSTRPWVSPTITSHDIQCLRAKWGV